MPIDVKGLYQEKAQELSWERYNEDFYDLPKRTQYQVFNEAMELVHEDLMSKAENIYESLRMLEGK